MNRRILWISCGLTGLLVGLAALVILMANKRGTKVTASFLKTEPSHGQFPLYEESERFDFAINNDGSKTATITVSAFQDDQGNWTPYFTTLGEVEARQSTQVYLYLPKGSRPISMRMRVIESASPIQKAQAALKLALDKAQGRYSGNQLWFPRLKVLASEFPVKLAGQVESNTAANASQPTGSNPNHATAPSNLTR